MTEPVNHLRGRTVIVTGAAGGFGRHLAEKTAALGANVGACDIDGDALADLADSADGQARVEVGTVDVTDLAAMRAFADRVVARFGAIDVMINNAGVMPLAFYADHEAAADAWDRCIDINIKGVLHGIIAVHDQMIARVRGQVVNISSVYGNAPVGRAAVYGASKAAVNACCPGVAPRVAQQDQGHDGAPDQCPAQASPGGIINSEAEVNPVLGANKDQFYDKLGQVFSDDRHGAADRRGQHPAGAIDPGQLPIRWCTPSISPGASASATSRSGPATTTTSCSATLRGRQPNSRGGMVDGPTSRPARRSSVRRRARPPRSVPGLRRSTASGPGGTSGRSPTR
ncbi:MAG: SDR family NAD(P)-dependent oxidoreductase [Ilumatobacteraceae bacterium]